MKLVFSTLILLFFGLSIFGCSNSTDTETVVSQVLFFYAEHYDSYWDEQIQEVVYMKNTTGGGVIFADPIPSLNYFKMGVNTYSGENFYNYYPGYLAFGEFGNSDVDVRITSNFTPLNIEVETSLGKLDGSIALPDTIQSITVSEEDTLELGQPFTISWSGSNAAFYSVYCEYFWIDNEGNWQWEDFDDFIIGNSITYPGSVFSHNGEIDYIRVQPINGPIPGAGSEGNMTGEGSGFLYYMVNGARYEGDDIIVGTGSSYYNITKIASIKKSEEYVNFKIKENLERLILEVE